MTLEEFVKYDAPTPKNRARLNVTLEAAQLGMLSYMAHEFTKALDAYVSATRVVCAYVRRFTEDS